MPQISETTDLSDIIPGKAFILAITDYNGHTTTLEYLDDAGNWTTVLDSSATSDFEQEVRPPTYRMRIAISGGTGSITYAKADLNP